MYWHQPLWLCHVDMASGVCYIREIDGKGDTEVKDIGESDWSWGVSYLRWKAKMT